MQQTKFQPVDSVENLRDRVERLLRVSAVSSINPRQLSLGLLPTPIYGEKVNNPSQSISSFLDLISAAMPDGDLYLFGGVLRDLALLGRKGFNSDIDLVVEGDWSNLVPYLEKLKADKNKFGGYRLIVDEWPIDIWNAKETWAIKQGLVPYKGIASLTETTVLNWDAILMNWRTRNFIYRKNYFEDINSKVLDIVLEENPNPIGMAVRVFRHFCLKDAAKIRRPAINYLANCAKNYSFEQLMNAEFRSYGNTVIEKKLHRAFELMDASEVVNIEHQFGIVSNIVEQELELR